ncbi:MAG: tetratricopeptide repeat protein [Acidobacteria bacterium]|nr:tetratricopeptide repeat protein [Acidobacteriota bacterium]
MKAKERHQLKENELARTAQQVIQTVGEYQRNVVFAVVIAIVLVAGVGGFFWWRGAQADKAGALLGIAQATANAGIAPPSNIPGARQAPGTFATPKDRAEAALKALQEVAAAYPSSDAAITANYEAAGQLLLLGRPAEAEALYDKVIATNSTLYAPMARMGLAQAKLAAGKVDDAVKLYTDLAAERDSALPVDGVLMQLADAYMKAGKPADAKAAYKRVVDEFHESPYVPEARQRLAALN